MNFLKLVTLFLIFSQSFIFGQQNHRVLNSLDLLKAKYPNMESCKTDQRHAALMINDPDYNERYQANNRKMKSVLGNQNKILNGIVTVPVVVHIIHLGEAEGTGTNISDAQINSAINNLNDCYSGAGSYVTDLEIQFQLAQSDPNCNATDGIIRVDASETSDYAANGITDANETVIKALSKWSNSLYYNIWIVSEIDNNDQNGYSGTQGYAYYPGAPSSKDGAVILFNSFGYDPTLTLGYNLKSFTKYNVTTNHELGHALNVKHTFEGDDNGNQCPDNTTPSTDGDECADTPAHKRGDGDCGSMGLTCDGGDLADAVSNIMSYSSDQCQIKFSSDQKARMRAALEVTRSSLLTSRGIDPPVIGFTAPLSPNCTPITQNTGNVSGILKTELNEINISSGSSGIDGGYIDYSDQCNSFFEIDATIPNTLNLDVYSVNFQQLKVGIDWNDDGDFNDENEIQHTSQDIAEGTTVSFTITYPTSIPYDDYIRCRALIDVDDRYGVPLLSSLCDHPIHGQAEDYSIYIKPAIGSIPVADFTADVTTLCATASVSFTDASTNTPTSWSWDFGDGNTSTSQNPTYSYAAGGTYTVALTATNSSGSDVETKTSYMTVSDCQTTQVRTIDCGITVSSFQQYIYADIVSGAEAYEFVYTNIATSQQFTKERPNYINSLYWANANEIGAIYDVKVRVKVAGVWSSYGATCQISSPNSIPTTQLRALDCGITVSNFNQYLFANPVPDAQSYQFLYTNTVTNQQFSKIRPNYVNSLYWANATEPGAIYDVQIRIKMGGTWGNYGAVCQVSAPSSIPTTQLRALDCGITVSKFNQYLFAIPVLGAQSYQFLYTNTATSQQFTKIRPNYVNSLYWGNALEIGATYDVQIRIMMDGIWGNYGATCQVSTPVTIPTTQVRSIDCGATVSSFSQYIYANQIIGAEEYQFLYTNSITSQQYTKTRVNYVNSLSWAGITDLSATYDVKVRLKFNGVWGNYGPTCQISTPGAAIMINSDYQEMISQKQPANQADADPIVLKTYPNPNNGFGIFVDIINPDYNDNKHSEITLLDMYGKIVYREIFKGEVTHQVKHISFNAKLEPGIYLLSIKNGDLLATDKIIVN